MSSLPAHSGAARGAAPPGEGAHRERARGVLARASLGVLGLVAILAFWAAGVAVLARHNALAAQFGPLAALQTFPALVTDDRLFAHIGASLRRIGVGLAFAMAIGVPLGFLIGRVKVLETALSPALQFLRMISPLSWMPIAVMSLGVGDPPVYFLLAFAAVWPIVMSTASGVQHIDARWVQLGESLAATRAEMLWHIYVPGIAAHVLTGVRLAIGVLWIVLVPAEMLGVSSGLGYLILDTRDRLAYSELMAVVLVIGALGFLLDHVARQLYRRFGAQR
ncbi:NitT/TauT family transport system permease protein [Paraburkholderia unamae]|nr:NitT/TauT family transport system permease protein [Paraburkholderia unamae]